MERLQTRIENFVRSRSREMIDLLERLVKSESPTSAPESQREVLNVLGTSLERAGCRVDYLRGRGLSGGHLYARSQSASGSPAQLIVGHCDTVWPIGTLAEMPFVCEKNVVRGPGVYDMKGGLVQGIYALKALHELGLQPALTPVFFVNSDEEIGSPESSSYLRLLARRVCRAFVLEPALGLSGKLKTSRKGGGRFVVHVEGRSAHAGLDPGRGASAILELSHVIQQLHALNDHERGITVNVGQIEGGIQPNVVAPAGKAVVDVRMVNPDDGLRIEETIRSMRTVTHGTKLRIEGRMGRPPMERTEGNQALWSATRELGRRMGLQLEDGLSGGASDGNTLSQFTATLDGMGAVGDGAHAPHEFLYIDKMIERTVLLASLLMLPADAGSESALFSGEAAPVLEERP